MHGQMRNNCTQKRGREKERVWSESEERISLVGRTSCFFCFVLFVCLFVFGGGVVFSLRLTGLRAQTSNSICHKLFQR